MIRIKGMLVTVYSDGTLVETKTEFEEGSGELFIENVMVNGRSNKIESQYFESDNGNIRHEVCKICHKFIMRSKFVEDEEVLECANGCTD